MDTYLLIAKAVLLHVVGQHPGGIVVDYAAVAVVALSVSSAFLVLALRRQPTPRPQSLRSMRRGTPPGARAMASALAPPFSEGLGGLPPSAPSGSPARAEPPMLSTSLSSVALSYLLLAVIAIQGFHVVEHIVLVVQVSGLGMSVAEAHGLLGARVDFEWLHFSYNTSFLGALALLLAYGVWSGRGTGTPSRYVQLAVLGAVGLQSYHVLEHVIRIVQYLDTGCAPCVGLIGQVVLFIWPHLFFGLFAYAGLLVGYFGYGLHRQLALTPPSRHDRT